MVKKKKKNEFKKLIKHCCILLCFPLRWIFVKKSDISLKILTGLIIVFLLHWFEYTKWGEGLLNEFFDRFYLNEANKAVKENAKMDNIFLVDICNKTKNSDHISPRHIIAHLVEMAFEGGASIIVLDFLFEEPDCCHPERDEILRKVLAGARNIQTKVILPVRIGHNNKIKPLIFDGEIDKNSNYFRASPTILASHSDYTVRYWKNYQKYEDNGNKILWSIPVLTFALHEGKLEELKNIEKSITKHGNKPGVFSIMVRKGYEARKILFPIDNEDIYLQRINFRLIPSDCIDSHPEGNTRIYTIEYLEPKNFADKIVIIGNSEPNVGDVHATPVGPMPGIFIQGNAIYTLLQGLQPRRVPWLISILLNTAIVIAGAWIFHKLDSFETSLIGFGAVAGIAIYIIFFDTVLQYLFGGTFPNFAIGIVGIGYMEAIYSLREKIAKKRKEKNAKEVSR